MVALRLVDDKVRLVVIRNPALVCPAGIVIEGGTLATDDSLPGKGKCVPGSTAARPTTVSVGTACTRVTVPWLTLPPWTVAGKTERLWRMPAITFGSTVNVAYAEVPA